MQDHVRISTLAALTGQQDWRFALPHAPSSPLLIWITRGQGVLLLNGTRRGVGTHNLIYVPAGALFALEAGRQTMGQVAICPPDLGALLPENARQLRIRDAGAISELTGLFEVAQREATGQHPFFEDALVAHMGLISVWLRRQLAMPENAQSERNAAARLSDSFCARVAAPDASVLSMAEHASAMGVTPTHLTRVCKTSTGRTAADILTHRILHSALGALYDTKVSAKDIAAELHFGSAAYFTRFIQHHTGKPPTALRK